MKNYGYTRISTKHQAIARQVDNIKNYCPEAVIIQEVYTGTKVEGRREWNRLYKTVLNEVKKGEEVTIIFDEVSRMSRNATEGFALYEELFNKGVNLVFLKEPHINTDTYKQALNNKLQVELNGDTDTNELMESIIEALNTYIMALAKKQIFLAFNQAEKEAEYLHQRTKEGLAQARLAGKRIGNTKGAKLTTKKSVEMKKVIQEKSKDFEGNITDTDLIKITGLSRNTFYKYKRELIEEINAVL